MKAAHRCHDMADKVSTLWYFGSCARARPGATRSLTIVNERVPPVLPLA